MNLIDKIIKECQDHFKKGNKTLGTLPNDWKNELNVLLEESFDAAKEEVEIYSHNGNYIEMRYSSFKEYIEDLENESK